MKVAGVKGVVLFLHAVSEYESGSQDLHHFDCTAAQNRVNRYTGE